MDFDNQSTFERKFVVYNGMKESGTLFKSNRKCMKYSLPDLSGLQMRLSSGRKDSKIKLRDDVYLDRSNTFVSTSCEVKTMSQINLNNENLKLSTISLFPSVSSTEEFKNDIKKNIKRSLRKKPFGSSLPASQSMPARLNNCGEMDKVVEEVLICGKPPMNTHISNKLTCEKTAG